MSAILGQERALHVLREAMRHQHVAHAWIFHGPFGVGKSTAALRFARLLLDPETTPAHVTRFEPPEETETARLIASGLHPDLHVVSRSLAALSDNPTLRTRRLANIPIDLLREFMIGGECGDGRFREAPVFKSAVLGHGKVFILEEAELLDFVGQNALLKTLEEPPRDTYLILLTTRVDRLLPTIRSRCQRVPFARLQDDDMRAWMRSHDLGLEGEAARSILDLAEGSPGTAMFAARHRLHEWVRSLASELDRVAAGDYPQKLGDLLAKHVDDLAKAIVKEREKGVEDEVVTDTDDEDDESSSAADGQPKSKASKQSANLEAAGWMTVVLGHLARRRLRDAVEANRDPSPWLALMDRIAEAERAVRSNMNLRHIYSALVIAGADDAATVAHGGGVGR